MIILRLSSANRVLTNSTSRHVVKIHCPIKPERVMEHNRIYKEQLKWQLYCAPFQAVSGILFSWHLDGYSDTFVVSWDQAAKHEWQISVLPTAIDVYRWDRSLR